MIDEERVRPGHLLGQQQQQQVATWHITHGQFPGPLCFQCFNTVD